MKKILFFEPHTETEVVHFSEEVNIPLERARYIENMRETYITWEHDYRRTLKEKQHASR